MIRQFIEALHAAKLDLSAEEIADILWLLVHRVDQQAEDVSSQFDQRFEDESRIRDRDPSFEELLKSNPDYKTPRPVSSRGQEAKSSADLYTHQPDRSNTSRTGMLALSGIEFSSPTVQALPNQLAVARSLRPFNLRLPSPVNSTLDTDATVQSIAEERVWLPVQRPASERWFELALVVDE